ncbi:hypothetical protein CIB93_02930 [Streptomyces sp. WZ.A104]|uniref:Uncharacterized protein n=1 Tax=Streptomyces durocortorensis TaxID=2811104 RepID=A0ABY9VNG9_9ACTN|nr:MULTISPECIES: hypothetical protein [Streptomyces]PCG87397.1 hypothetical protein CIB93_02930 [Streptomyces sp. WZ.A104]WNF25479.1 hypothetical protein RI138_00920 [Streptomyces durocortorensis]
MDDAAFSQLLLGEEDLEESFYGEEPSAAYDPVFVSGDASGRTIVDLTNMLTHGTHPETTHHASALFTNIVGSVVFHHVAQFGDGACRQVYQELLDAVRDCSHYRMGLNDGVQLDITKVAVEPIELGDGGFLVRWLSTVDHFRIETAWVIVPTDGILSFINTRIPEASEIHRLARIAIDRVVDLTGTS